MPIRDTIQTNTVTLGELLGNGRFFRVPRFQRNYSWGPTEWEDLWGDILAAEATGRDHYLGAVVLQPTAAGKGFEVIDGQQRLATLSVLAMALVAQFEEWALDGLDGEANRERAELFRDRLVSPRDPRSLKRSSRVRLNDHDDAFFQSAIVNGHAPANVRRLEDSERSLWDCWLFFRARVAERAARTATGEALAGFVDDVYSQRLLFIEIVVDDEAAAYTVFETLNARGVALGTADLLKNYLFSLAASGGRADLEEVQRLWGRLVSTTSLHVVADLVHHHENARTLNVSKRSLFRHVRDRVATKAGAFDYLRELLVSAEWYAALLDPHDDLWLDHSQARPWIRVLHLLGVTQYRPLALAAAPLLADQPDRLARLFQLIAVVSVRANVVVKLNTGDIHRAWNQAAVDVTRRGDVNMGALRAAVDGVYPDDQVFKAAFAELVLPASGRTRKLARYLLATLEHDAGGVPIDWETAPFSIEHIMPERPGEAWELSDRDHARFVHHIGNLVPLEPPLNRDVGNASFRDKVDAYLRSAYALARAVHGEAWTGESVRQRARQLARRAAHIWRLD